MKPPAACGDEAEDWLPVLRPQLPDPELLLPWLKRIKQAGWYTNFGPLCEKLEQDLAQILSEKSNLPVSVCTTSNGTTALELALEGLQRARGGRVLIPSLTFPATATAVMRAGLQPWLCDVELEGEHWGLSPEIAEKLVRDSAGDEIAAVVPVAIFGCPQDASAWDQFTRRTGIPVVIDAAGAFGNQLLGESTAAIFSMHATKTLACGEGGFVASADAQLVKRVRTASNFGLQELPARVTMPGTNAKLSEYHSAVALASLSQWQTLSEKRLALASAYAEEISKHFSGEVILQQQGRLWIRSVFVVRLPGHDIQAIAQALADCGIETRRWYYPALHQHPAFSNHRTHGDFANTRQLAQELLGLPFHLNMAIQDVKRVCQCLRDALCAAQAS